MITEPFPGYTRKRFRDHERGLGRGCAVVAVSTRGQAETLTVTV